MAAAKTSGRTVGLDAPYVAFFSDVGEDLFLSAFLDAGLLMTESPGSAGTGLFREVAKLTLEVCSLVGLSLHAFSVDSRSRLLHLRSLAMLGMSLHVAVRPCVCRSLARDG